MEEGTRGNDWTREPQQMQPGGKGKARAGEGAAEGQKAGTDSQSENKVLFRGLFIS